MRRHPSKQQIKVAADAAIFTVIGGRLQILLIRMKKRPFTGRWALPGGLLGDRDTARSAVCRILEEQAGMTSCYFLEQLAAFDTPARDPLGRVVSIGHFALVPPTDFRLRTTPKYSDVRWWRADRLPPLAYDHKAQAAAALARLRSELGRSNIAWSVLPRAFTLAQAQSVYEAILGRTLDKRNFRKKFLALGLAAPLGRKSSGAHRPAALYRFRSRRAAGSL